MKVNVSSEKIDAILDRGVIVNILPSKEDFKKLLLGGKRLRLYLGIDPTSSSLHLGHAQNILLLKDFQSLGHEAVLLVGDFTARIGDPSEKSKTRKQLSEKEVKENTKHLENQLSTVFKDNPLTVRHNNEWLSKLTFEDVVALASNFTVQQMVERDMFARRIKDKNPIHLHEFFYPLMQGYDSVALDTDVEIGGTDQTFNMLAGRTLQKRFNDKEKFVIATKLIENPKTGELMSMSAGTGVFLDSLPEKMFGQIMAQPDEMIEVLFLGNTRVPLEEVNSLVSEAGSGGTKTRDVKLRLAEEIVSIYHSKEKATGARENFISVFKEKGTPTNIKEIEGAGMSLVDLLARHEGINSKTNARRLIADGAVEINDKVVKDTDKKINSGDIIKVGKHRFFKAITN